MKRIAKHLVAFLGIVTLFLALQACSGNSNVSTGVAASRSSSGDWGNSITFGINSHGRGW